MLVIAPPLWRERPDVSGIGKGSGAGRVGIYFLGGVHAREWGSPDILVNFVQLLANAYRTNTDM
ncbi:M14 family zinc carboxypeptidase, partial [Paraburkholderia sediminicola]|uniref:M14 family zinc carboxypeptidase n=1 Tax=Paraburkholderia TaxID=1822464 RepID=UPI0038B85CDD